MKTFNFIIFLFSIFGFTSYQNVNVVGIGDSITLGYPYDVESSYSYMVYKYLEKEYPYYNYTYNNMAVNGLTSSLLLDNLSNNVTLIESINKADLVMVSIGSNDFLSLLNTSSYQDNLDDSIASTVTLLEDNLKYLVDYFHYKHPNTKVIFIPYYNPYNKLANYSNYTSIINKLNDERDLLNGYLSSLLEKEDNMLYLNNVIFSLEENNNVTSLTSLDPHPNKRGQTSIYNSIISSNFLSFLERKDDTLFYIISIFLLISVIIIIGYIFNKHNKNKVK